MGSAFVKQAHTISIISMLRYESIFSYKKKSEPKAVRFSLRVAGGVKSNPPR